MRVLYGALRDCDIQFWSQLRTGLKVASFFFQSTDSSLLFIHPLSLTLLLTPSLADMCSEPVYCDRSACPSPQRLPLLPPRLGACQASGLTAGAHAHTHFLLHSHSHSTRVPGLVVKYHFSLPSFYFRNLFKHNFVSTEKRGELQYWNCTRSTDWYVLICENGKGLKW